VSPAKQAARTVFVDNIGDTTDVDFVANKMSVFGKVRYVSIPKRFVVFFRAPIAVLGRPIDDICPLQS
jgi:hypothetical protein